MKSPKFYCENCRREVSARDKICPGCGRFFSDVRCPRCGFTGGAGQFYAGCPRCGYLSSPLPYRQGDGEEGKGTGEIRIPLDLRSHRNEGPGEGKKNQLWFFLAVTIGLALVLVIILSLYIDLGRKF